MRRLFLLVVLVVILGGLRISVLSDSPLTDSHTPDIETISTQSTATNSSATAGITITMYAVEDE